MAERAARRESERSASRPSPRRLLPLDGTANPVVRLQQSIGNQRFSRLIQSQAALTRSRANTPEEHAARAMDEEHDPAERAADAFASGMAARTAPGPDLSRIPVRTDAEAARRARAIGARAFTSGTEIFFAEGAFDPTSTAGRALLLHEVAHLSSGPGLRRKPDPIISMEINRHDGRATLIARSGTRYSGVVTTDLARGTYRLTANKASKTWGIAGSQPGLRFDLTLDDADPWVLTYVADLPLKVSDEVSVGETLGAAAAVAAASPPTADPRYLEQAVKRVAVFGWGGPFRLSKSSEGLSPEDWLVPRSEFHLDDDPLAAASFELQHVYKTRADAEKALAALPGGVAGKYTYYLGPGGMIFPTIVSNTTSPGVCATLRLAWKQHQEDARAAAKFSKDLLWWYVGARMPVKTEAAPAEAAKDVGKGGAIVAASKIEQALQQIVDGTASIANPGQRMVEAAKLLSRMSTLSAAEKVQVILKFFDRIGFAISKTGVVEKADHFIMYSEDSRYAFKFMKGAGEIAYGKFDMAAMDYVWTVLK
jgi:hypothetical protein